MSRTWLFSAPTDDFFRQVRGDEDDAGDGAQDHVARQAGRLADAAGDVEARHGDIADAGGVDAAVVDVDALDLDDLLQGRGWPPQMTAPPRLVRVLMSRW